MKSKQRNLKKKVEKFIDAHYKGPYNASSFLDEISAVGEVVIIGGLLRDLCFYQSKDFNSDVDLVIRTENLDALEELLASYKAEKNRFGGYGIITGKWRTDIWVLENTWVSTAGHHAVNTFEDLLQSTFFNWDAVYYHYNKSELVSSDNYFEHLQNRLLNINCRPNPNPLGNALRAIVSLKKYNATLAPQLASFVADVLQPEAFASCKEYIEEKTSPYYSYNELLSLQQALFAHCEETPDEPFHYQERSNQLTFELLTA